MRFRLHGLHAALLLLCMAADLRAEPTVVRELHYGEALFMFYQEQHFEAITRLQAGRMAGHIQQHDEEAQLLLGGMLLSWGQHSAAAEIFQRLLADSVRAEVRDRAWLQLARISYQRGALMQAASALAAIGEALPRHLGAEKRLLEAQVLMRDGQYAQAAARLEVQDGSPAWRAYARYNLGVAMLRQQRLAEGVRHLEYVGGLNGSEEVTALADRANLALGFMLLQQEDPAAARSVLQRVRLQGPHSNQALLGVGWAESALGRHRESLTPWLALRERDLLDPAVQESLLAIPYAFASLDAHGQAAESYQQAVTALEDEAARLQETIAVIRQGGLVAALLAADDSERRGLYWQLDELPDRFESRYLYRLLATHEFQEGLKNFRDLDFLGGVLSEWADKLGAFADMVATQQLAWEQRAPRSAELMATSEIADLHRRHAALQARLAEANARRDLTALMRDEEPTRLAELDEVAARLAALGDDGEAAELGHRERLLRGVLMWQLSAEFPARAWQQRRELRDLQPVLAQMQAREARIRALQDGAAERFEAQARRIASLGPRVAALHMDVEAAHVRQRLHLEAMAVTALETQVARLRSHELQARFALARIYDRAAADDVGTVRPGGEP